MRKSIFDIVSESMDMHSETYRIIAMAENESTLCLDNNIYRSVFKFVSAYCFNDWEYRGHFIGVADFLDALEFEDLKRRATYDVESHLTLIELVYNFWYLTYSKFDDKEFGNRLKWCGNYYHLKDVMDDILEQYNQTIYIKEGEIQVLVVENKPEVTAVAEIMPTASLSLDVVKYNHRSLKGDIKQKKAVLISLGTELEPKRGDLEKLNKQLSSDIFFMLNNMNIRHNNCNEADPSKYQKYVAEMDEKQLEEWYDELYQMMLLAFLLLDNTDRTAKVITLKTAIANSKIAK